MKKWLHFLQVWAKLTPEKSFSFYKKSHFKLNSNSQRNTSVYLIVCIVVSRDAILTTFFLK